MSALLETKNMDKTEILEKIAALDIPEAGLCGGKLADRLKECARTGADTGVAAALNNADTDYVLLEVLKNDPEKVLEGISIAAQALSTDDKTLYVPESETELAKSLEELAAKYGVEVKAEFLNVRANEQKLLMHIVTAADLADGFRGNYAPGVYVSVNGSPVTRVAYGTRIAELADLSDAKALILGYQVYKPEAAELAVEEAGIANGVVKVLTTHDCVVNETEKRVMASRKQSCGKCVFCREGLIQLQYMQKEITEGRGKVEYVDLTREIGEAMCIPILENGCMVFTTDHFSRYILTTEKLDGNTNSTDSNKSGNVSDGNPQTVAALVIIPVLASAGAMVFTRKRKK